MVDSSFLIDYQPFFYLLYLHMCDNSLSIVLLSVFIVVDLCYKIESSL